METVAKRHLNGHLTKAKRSPYQNFCEKSVLAQFGNTVSHSYVLPEFGGCILEHMYIKISFYIRGRQIIFAGGSLSMVIS